MNLKKAVAGVALAGGVSMALMGAGSGLANAATRRRRRRRLHAAPVAVDLVLADLATAALAVPVDLLVAAVTSAAVAWWPRRARRARRS